MEKKLLIIFGLIFFAPLLAFSQEKTETSAVKDTLIIGSSIREMLIKKAKEYIGVKYRRGQSNKNGFDCSGFVKYVYEKFNFSLPHSSRAQFKQCKQIKIEDAQPGDLVFFVTLGKRISHVGIYLGDHLFIHAPSRGLRVSISTLDALYYKKRLVGFGSVL
jgi:cell wall-associated NlpC family hydrolase